MVKALCRLLLAALAGFVLSACIVGGGISRSIVAARWVKADTLLAFAVLETDEAARKWSPIFPESPEYLRSAVQVYLMRVPGGCKERREVHSLEGAISCGDFGYRAQDSLLYFTHIPFSQKNIKRAGRCSGDGASLEAGKLRNQTWVSAGAVNDSVLRAALVAAGPSDLPISPYGALCPPGCLCFNE